MAEKGWGLFDAETYGEIVMQAVLILAHKDIEQIIKLCKLLTPYFCVYIHFDQKYNIPIEQKKKLQEMENVQLFQNFMVNWGAYSIVNATVFLLEKVLKNKSIQYIHLISGQDWPVRPIKDVYTFYEQNDFIYMTYIESEKVVKSGEPTILWQKYYFDYDRIKRKTTYGKIYHRLTMLWQTIKRVNKFKDLHIEYPIYQGSQWCSMPRYAAEYCLNKIQHDKSFATMLKTGFCSDEVFFQTALVNSPYKENIINDNRRYIKWIKEYNNAKRYPAILTEMDYTEITSGKFDFARKIDLTRSEKLIEKLGRTNV